MKVTFFGVRGSCPCAGERYHRVGGNTACVLVTVGDDPPLILDLGTGLRALGEELMPQVAASGQPLDANVLLTHLHFDHILGLPFFSPLHKPGTTMTIYGPHQGDRTLERTVPVAVQPPFFPVHMDDFDGEARFLEAGDDCFAVGNAKVVSRAIPHLGRTLGFRVEAAGRVLAYLPDHQAPPDHRSVPDAVAELCAGADLVVHDAQYTDEEFARKPDWGHSTVAYALAVAAEAGARRLLLFHHDPSHSDADLEHQLEVARSTSAAGRLDDVSLAVEGMTVDLGAL